MSKPPHRATLIRLLGLPGSWVFTALLATQANFAARAQDQPAPSTELTIPVAQPGTPQESASAGQTAPPSPIADDLALRAGLVCGQGASVSSVAARPTTQCGALFGFGYLETEIGIMGPQANRSSVSGYLSENAWIPLRPSSTRGLPVAIGGYTRMFETGHAVDYGVAFTRPVGKVGGTHFLQFEVRDYYAFANPNQHNVVFRVIWLLGSGSYD